MLIQSFLGEIFILLAAETINTFFEVSLREIAERGFALPLDVPVKSENNA